MLATESPEVYAVTSRGYMPSIFVRFENEFSVLRPVNSRREYTFRADQILSVADAESAIRAQRVDAVLSNYSIKLVARGTLNSDGSPVQVHRVTHPTDARRSYLVTTGAALSCTCPDMQKRQIGSCKHVHAVQEFTQQQEKPAKRTPATYSKDEW